MCNGFERDFFSVSKINWNKKIDKKKLHTIKSIVKKNISPLNFIIKQNSGRELNSNNFKLILKSKKFILKRWSRKMKISEIKDIIDLIVWLDYNKINTPIPQKFNNNKYIVKNKNEYWSYFNFVDGNHFKGQIKEMKNVAKFVGIFMDRLKKYRNKNIKKTYKYFSKEDSDILKFLEKNFLNLDNFFSKEHAKQIKKKLPEIINLFNTLKRKKIKKEKTNLIHMDIHPHNLITENSKVKAILDLDSCVKGEIGHALSYTILKICKQTAVFNNKLIKKNIKKIFVREIKKNYKLNKTIENNFYYYALSEVLRRLIVMFKLSIKRNNRSWNNVIPIQLNHINECKTLFLN
ncbi:phosphotransferase [Candidatus Pelagibacter ubique]|nr:phosphotransferase [Candidatus Pelagibacter ubique]